MSEKFNSSHSSKEQATASEDHQFFDPKEELNKLKTKLESLPKAEREAVRSESFDKFRALIGFQREEIAKISAEVDDYLDDNPSASMRQLMEIVYRHAPDAMLSPSQLEVFEQRIARLIQANLEIRQVVARAQEVYGSNWTKGLFTHFFDVSPKSSIGVSAEKGTLFFDVRSKADWRAMCRAHHKKYGVSRKGIAFVLPQDKEVAGKHFIVGAKNNTAKLAPEEIAGSVEAHELRHSVDRIIEPDELGFSEWESLASKHLTPISSEGDIERFINIVLRDAKESLFRSVRSEILAYIDMGDYILDNTSKPKQLALLASVALADIMKNHRFTSNTKAVYQGVFDTGHSSRKNAEIIQGFKTRMNSNSSAYDYRERFAEVISHQISKNTGQDYRTRVDQMVAEEFENHLVRQLDEAIEAAVSIQRECNLTSHQAMWLLQNEPMQYWPNLADRIKKGNEIKKSAESQPPHS